MRRQVPPHHVDPSGSAWCCANPESGGSDQQCVNCKTYSRFDDNGDVVFERESDGPPDWSEVIASYFTGFEMEPFTARVSTEQAMSLAKAGAAILALAEQGRLNAATVATVLTHVTEVIAAASVSTFSRGFGLHVSVYAMEAPDVHPST